MNTRAGMKLKMKIEPIKAKMMIKADGAVGRMAFFKSWLWRAVLLSNNNPSLAFRSRWSPKENRSYWLFDFLMNDRIDRIK
jgi:hypothetical protein